MSCMRLEMWPALSVNAPGMGSCGWLGSAQDVGVAGLHRCYMISRNARTHQSGANMLPKRWVLQAVVYGLLAHARLRSPHCRKWPARVSKRLQHYVYRDTGHNNAPLNRSCRTCDEEQHLRRG